MMVKNADIKVNEQKMMGLRFTFDYQKSTQALNYFAIKEGTQINKMKALKLIFLADRYHLRKYGRLITNDSYLAMKHGPVPSTTKDIAESNDYLDELIKTYSTHYLEAINNLVLKSKAEIDISVFSESDLEALKFAWDNFGKLNQFQLRDLTHLYPEWEKFEEALSTGGCLQINLMDFLKDSSANVNKCFELNDEDKEIRSEQIVEMAYIQSLWR